MIIDPALKLKGRQAIMGVVLVGSIMDVR